MSHFAEIDENNIVTRVLVGDNAMPNEGYDWFVSTFGGRWIQTSYNNNFRGTFAAVGYTYNEAEDIFVVPQPYPSWIRSGSFWVAPVALPTDGLYYDWDEKLGDWVEA